MHLINSNQSGFTLIELIAVIMILSALAVVGSSKFFSSTAFRESQYQQEILSALRYGQQIAIASQCPVVISFAANSYNLNYGGSCAAVGLLKKPNGQGNYSESGLNTTITSTSANYTYDALGDITPSAGGTITIGGRSITIEAGTGFAHD